MTTKMRAPRAPAGRAMRADGVSTHGTAETSRHRAFFALLMVALLAAVTVGVACTTTTGPSKATKKATIAITQFTGSAAVYVAREKGFFAEEGVEATLPLYASGGLAVAALADGKADMATAAETPIVRAILNGKPLAVVATISEVEHSNVMIARKDAGIAAARDLAGKRVGVARGTAADFFLHIYLLSSRIDPQTVQVVALQPDAVVEAIMSRQVDAVATWDPYVGTILQRLGGGALVLDEPGIYTLTWNTVTRIDLTESDPDLITRLTRAMAKGSDYAVEHPDEAQSITAKATGIDLATTREKWADYRSVITLDQSLLLSMEDEARWMRSVAPTSSPEIPDFTDHIYTGALKAVRPAEVRIIE
jgi:ABC-type nitrate/sulfonate/bicarbonate transport system substrate-binding protein